MALHTQLPIYKVAYDLLDIVTDLVKNMPRDYKQAIGSELRDQCLQMSLLVLRANIAQTKEPHLAGIIERKETLELLIRLSCDLRLISRAQYAGAIERLASIGRQANGWRKQQLRQTHGG